VQDRQEKARDRDAVRLLPVPLDTAPGTGVAARAVIQIKHKDALTFVKALLDILIQNAMTHRRAVEASERLLYDPAAQSVKLA
jgi:hypothetical protein